MKDDNGDQPPETSIQTPDVSCILDIVPATVTYPKKDWWFCPYVLLHYEWALYAYQYQNPESDSVIYVKNLNMQIGKYYKVKIVNYEGYDLEGEILWIHLRK